MSILVSLTVRINVHFLSINLKQLMSLPSDENCMVNSGREVLCHPSEGYHVQVMYVWFDVLKRNIKPKFPARISESTTKYHNTWRYILKCLLFVWQLQYWPSYGENVCSAKQEGDSLLSSRSGTAVLLRQLSGLVVLHVIKHLLNISFTLFSSPSQFI
jgi:hypothetical protein